MLFLCIHRGFCEKNIIFANRIKVMLAERMVSNKELAEMLGKDPATVSKWVTNTSQPSLENLIEIARCLKCEINDLVRT